MNAASAELLLEQLHGMTFGYSYDLPKRPPRPKVGNKNRRSFFFTLPGEIRNTIYRFAAKEETKPFLQCFRPPGMLGVSRQMRLESLPIFFEVNTFIVEVVAPAALFPVARPWGGRVSTRAHFFRVDDGRYAKTGNLLLKPCTEASLRTTTSDVRIGNLDIIPLNFNTPDGSRGEHLKAVVSLRTLYGTGKRTEVTCHVHGSTVDAIKPAFNDMKLEADLKHITGAATSFLQAQAARDGFLGLTLSGLFALARTIRVKPRVGPDALIDDFVPR